MSTVDQARAYLSLRENITALRQEFGEDIAWHIVEQAVRANMENSNILVHRVSKPRLKSILTNKTGELA